MNKKEEFESSFHRINFKRSKERRMILFRKSNCSNKIIIVTSIWEKINFPSFFSKLSIFRRLICCSKNWVAESRRPFHLAGRQSTGCSPSRRRSPASHGPTRGHRRHGASWHSMVLHRPPRKKRKKMIALLRLLLTRKGEGECWPAGSPAGEQTNEKEEFVGHSFRNLIYISVTYIFRV